MTSIKVNIEAGTGGTASRTITVTTELPHNLNTGTPIRIRNVSDDLINVSTKVTQIDSTNPNIFQYTVDVDPGLLTAQPTIIGGETVTIETDTVTGASPYVFNISLRSVWGMNGMHADGSKADGFRSMVVAQFTGVSLQKDDRAFVKYTPSDRNYSNTITIGDPVHGNDLSAQSSSPDKVLHLDSRAIYRSGWEQGHIRITNDAILQIVSVFAIGYNKHFSAESGGDASITNSNSNFCQLSLISEGFKKDAFTKDNKAFITNIVGPRALNVEEEEVDWLAIDLDETNTAEKLYLFGFKDDNVKPPVLTQGYRVGAKEDDILYVKEIAADGTTTVRSAKIAMQDSEDPNTNNFSAKKEYKLTAPSNYVFTVQDTDGNNVNHQFLSGEKVILISDNGDLPENIKTNTVYYVIDSVIDISLTSQQIKLAASESEALGGEEITVYGGTNITIISRVSDKIAGDPGHPIQHDGTGWFIHTNPTDATIHTITGSGDSEPSYLMRKTDSRGLDDKLYKVRVVVPKELLNAKTPESGFVIQETSSTGVRGIDGSDFNLTTLVRGDYEYNKKLRFIANCVLDTSDPNNKFVTVTSELPHNLTTGDRVIIRNVKDVDITSTGEFKKGYNGDFDNITVLDDFRFTYPISVTPGAFSNDTYVRDNTLPRFERNDLKSNLYVYRNEVIQEYEEGADGKDGIYYLYVANADNAIPIEFTDTKYSQNIVDLYPQLDRDNLNDNPLASRTFAARNPIGEVNTNDLKKSITKESLDKLTTKFGVGLSINTVSTNTITLDNDHGLGGITEGSLSDNGGSLNIGTYNNVKLLVGSDDPVGSTWNGATVKFEVVSGNSIDPSTIEIVSPGSNHSLVSGVSALYIDRTVITNSPHNTHTSPRYDVTEVSPSSGFTVQFTGSGTTEDSYYKIDASTTKNSFTIHRPSNDPETITNDQYAYVTGLAYDISTASYDQATNLTTITTSSSNDLNVGHRITIRNSTTHAKVGRFFVIGKDSATVLTVKGDIGLTSGCYILRPGFDANDKTSDSTEESINVRGITLFDDQTLTLSAPATNITSELIFASSVNMARFPLGSYIQVDDEIMRVSNADLQSGNKIIVIRGVLGTKKAAHISGSLVKKIAPIPIEFRRPSILRASGHTFEYLGYGPGNYSTGLPQVQDRTITEREEFLSQAQERAAGIVVYTGMNNKGDFFIGNQRKSASTGEETTFDTPVPTVTGENPSRLSAVFDEVTVKERIVVEGGKSNQILSQFNGPVTFSEKVRIKRDVDFTEESTVKIKNPVDSIDLTSGALQVSGGVAIGKTTNIGGRLTVKGSDESNGTSSTSTTTGSVVITGGTGISENLHVGGTGTFGNNLSITGDFDIPDDKKIKLGDETNGDLQIYHDGTNGASYISDTGTGPLRFTSNGGGGGVGAFLFSATGERINMRVYGTSGAENEVGVGLYFNGSTDPTDTETGKKLETNSNGVDVSGELRVTGDIVAFVSDDRLKTNKVGLTNALDKVNSLNGFTYNFNETAGALGFSTDTSEVGVSAQEVQAVLPEVIKEAPVGSEYITVQYHKLVPLLIEAIKELSDKVDSLEQRLNN